MRTRDRDRFKKLLLEKKRELLKEMGLVMESQFSDTIKERTGELSSHTYHMADQGTDAMERELAFMYASKSGRLVYHIDEALRRIEEGTYGQCQSCGKQISTERLEAVPHARYCIACKSAEEEKKAGRR